MFYTRTFNFLVMKWFRWVVTATAVLALGCSGNGGDSSMSEFDSLSAEERDSILAYLGVHGFDVSTVRADGQLLRIEGDIVFKVEELRRRSHEIDEKGYLASSLHPAVAQHLGLQFDSSVPARWKAAFEYAANQWSNATWHHHDIAIDMNGGVFKIGVTRNVIIGLDTCVFAESDYPDSGLVGNVRINPIFFDGACGCVWTDDFLRKVAMHELGHSLGFMHPKNSPFDWIAGTGLGTSYSTVMAQGYFEATGLYSDDRQSAALVYEF